MCMSFWFLPDTGAAENKHMLITRYMAMETHTRICPLGWGLQEIYRSANAIHIQQACKDKRTREDLNLQILLETSDHDIKKQHHTHWATGPDTLSYRHRFCGQWDQETATKQPWQMIYFLRPVPDWTQKPGVCLVSLKQANDQQENRWSNLMNQFLISAYAEIRFVLGICRPSTWKCSHHWNLNILKLYQIMEVKSFSMMAFGVDMFHKHQKSISNSSCHVPQRKWCDGITFGPRAMVPHWLVYFCIGGGLSLTDLIWWESAWSAHWKSLQVVKAISRSVQHVGQGEWKIDDFHNCHCHRWMMHI